MRDCEICDRRPATDLVVEMDASVVITVGAGALDEGVWVVTRKHAAEPFELSGTDRRRFWDESMRVAAALREVSGAGRMSYAIDGRSDDHTRLRIEAHGATASASPDDLRRALTTSLSRRTTEAGPATTVYDEMAASFEENAADGFYNAHYDRPAVLAACGQVRDLDVLDVGCGPGYYLEALRSRGAHVVGVDGSAELLARARARVGPDIDLVQHDLELPLTMFGARRFDLVVMPLVHHHVTNRHGLLRELHRVLRPGGRLVLSSSHPTADWFMAGGSYFTVERVESVFVLGDRGRWLVPFWRLPMSVLVNEVIDAGFVLDELIEPVPEPEHENADPRVYRRLLHEPGFVVLRAHSPA